MNTKLDTNKQRLWNALEGAIDIDEVQAAQNRRREINKIGVRDIKLVKDGTEIKVTAKERADFEYTGLNTIDFIEWVGRWKNMENRKGELKWEQHT